MNHTLEEVPDCKYLGVTISNDLKWQKHINNVHQKSNKLLGFLRRNLKHCPKSLKETAYKSLVRSNLEYCATIWDPYFHKDINKLNQIQRLGILEPELRNNELSYTQIPAQTTYFANSFFVRYRTIPEWNNLPSDIVYIQDTVKFCDSLHKLN